MGLNLPVPYHGTLSRRARTLAVAPQARTASGPVHLLVDSTEVKLSGPGKWLVEKQGTQRHRAAAPGRRCDARTGMLVASTLTSKEADDAAELEPVLDQVEEPLAAVVADGAYDQDRIYDDVAACCTEEEEARETPFPADDQATRTELGHPRSSIRLRTWAAMATSVARAWSLWKRSPSPMTCFQRANWLSTRALSL